MTKRVHAALGRRRHTADKTGRRRRGILAATTAAVALLVAATAAYGSVTDRAGTGSHAPQRIGTAPRLPAGATAAGATASGTTLHIGVHLAPRDPKALADFVTAVSTPGNSRYHQYLGKGQFASARR
jgi:hypothetical protein